MINYIRHDHEFHGVAKLSSGEEMIARLDSETDEWLTLAKPYILVAAQNGMALAPYMFTVSPDTKIKLKINSIICINFFILPTKMKGINNCLMLMK